MSHFTANFDLTPHNTLRLTARAAQGFELTDLNQLSIISDWQASQRPWLVVGEGANILFCDDFDGLVVINRLGGRSLIETEDAWVVDVAAGENWHDLVAWLVDKEVGGLENLALIPGTVGAAPVQNIGAYGIEFEQFCESVSFYDVEARESKQLERSECQFGYRESIFKRALQGRVIITSTRLRLPKAWQPKLSYGLLSTLTPEQQTSQHIFSTICQIRREKLPDPDKLGNAGSFFKNPVVTQSVVDSLLSRYPQMPVYPDGKHFKLAAGWLIDRCGLKGERRGAACVHLEQALVLTNLGGAHAAQILELAQHVRQQVKDAFQVLLEPEVRFIGRHGLLIPEQTLERFN